MNSPIAPSFPTISFRVLALTLSIAVFSTLLAQEDEDFLDGKLRPTIGLGAGMLSFYGDIGENHDVYSPLVTRVGYGLRASTPVASWLEVGLYAITGKVGANERSSVRNLNFESKVTSGGLELIYNFDQILNKKRAVGPYLSIGIGSMEYLSKTDLYDGQGREYNYWSDGTIRDIPEESSMASQATIIQRDYVYESDIRELDLDGFGKYNERTWAVPIGVGARMNMGGGFDARIGATLHYTLSDLVDGVTEDSREQRVGNSNNDMFLFTSFSLGYGINLDRKKKGKDKEQFLSPEELEILAQSEDEDGDGVTDLIDDSPRTPAGVAVNERGVPVDTDQDLVPDHIDLEPSTALGAPVNMDGVTMGDEDFLLGYQMYMDSTGQFAAIAHSMVESRSGPNGVRRQGKRTYVVQVGSEVESITEATRQKILSIPDVRTVNSNDTTFYVVGDHEKLPEAIQRQMDLEQQGISGTVVAKQDGELIDIADEVAKASGEIPSSNGTDTSNEEAVIRVQLGAFRYKLSKDIFANVPDLVTLQGDDGLTRYYTGAFSNVNQAAEHKVDKLMDGFEGAFLVAFKGGKRVSLKEAGATLTREDDLNIPVTGTVNKELINYRIQIGAFAGNVPADVMGKLLEVGEVGSVTTVAGRELVRYLYGSFKKRQGAEDVRKELQDLGLTDAFVVGDFNGAIIPAEEADRLLSE